VLPVVGEVADFLSMKELRAAQEEPSTQPTTVPTQPVAASAVPRDLATAGTDKG